MPYTRRQMYPMVSGQEMQSPDGNMMPFVASPRPRRISQRDITANATRANAMMFNANQYQAVDPERADQLRQQSHQLTKTLTPYQQDLRTQAVQNIPYGGRGRGAVNVYGGSTPAASGNMPVGPDPLGGGQVDPGQFHQSQLDAWSAGDKKLPAPTAEDSMKQYQVLYPKPAQAPADPLASPPANVGSQNRALWSTMSDVAKQSAINNGNFVPGATNHRIGITEGTLQGVAIRGAQQGMTPEQSAQDVKRFAEKYNVAPGAGNNVANDTAEGTFQTPYVYNQNNQLVGDGKQQSYNYGANQDRTRMVTLPADPRLTPAQPANGQPAPVDPKAAAANAYKEYEARRTAFMQSLEQMDPYEADTKRMQWHIENPIPERFNDLAPQNNPGVPVMPANIGNIPGGQATLGQRNTPELKRVYAEGQTATGPNGQRVVYRQGKWVPAT
jgi:hypothetical protein